MRVLRKNVLIDSGELIDPSFAPKGGLIAIPEICKRINNRGVILGVAKGCRIISQKEVGKTCILKVEHHDDYRIKPRLSKRMGLKPTWHFIIPEDCIHAVIEE